MIETNKMRIDRLKDGTFTQDDLAWCISVTEKHYNKIKRARSNIRTRIIIPDCIPTLTIKERSENLRLYINSELTILESYGMPVAIFKDGQYYIIKMKGVETKTRNHIEKFIKCQIEDIKTAHRFPQDMFQKAYDKLDRSNVKTIDYLRNSLTFWNN